jgi:UDP-N-acetylmuramate dehydrogenase
LKALASRCPVSLEIRKPLAPLTTFRAGGPASLFARPGDAGELAGLLGFAASEGVPHFILGGGSNVLFDDSGLEGLVIQLSGSFRAAVAMDAPAGRGGGAGRDAPAGEGGGAVAAWAGAGARLSRVADLARSLGRSGWAALRGIPGTVGGALHMNAGAMGAETGALALYAEVLAEAGGGFRVERVPGGEAGFRYRGSDLAGKGVILGAAFQLGPPAPDEEIALMERGVLESRKARIPRGPSAGSVFRNPPGDSAGRLIDSCGLKGLQAGGAAVSDLHANVIVNAGAASASDIRGLAMRVRDEVARAAGVGLEFEIVMLDRYGRAFK